MNSTPGPWKAEGFAVYHTGDLPLAQVATDYLYDVSSDPEWNERSAIGHAEATANARLIAAAPALLEALRAILIQVVQGKVLERDACITQARAALRLAEGGPPEPRAPGSVRNE